MKTKLGISTGLLSALAFFAALYSGWLAVLLITGYVFLFETDAALKKNSLTATVLMVIFYLASSLINLVPNLIGLLDDMVAVFDGYISVPVIGQLATFSNSLLALVEKVLFILLAILSLGGKSVSLPLVNKLVEGHTGECKGVTEPKAEPEKAPAESPEANDTEA